MLLLTIAENPWSGNISNHWFATYYDSALGSLFKETRFDNASLSKITIFNYLFIFFLSAAQLPHNLHKIAALWQHILQKITEPGRIICLFGRMRYHIICQKIPHLNVAPDRMSMTNNFRFYLFSDYMFKAPDIFWGSFHTDSLGHKLKTYWKALEK